MRDGAARVLRRGRVCPPRGAAQHVFPAGGCAPSTYRPAGTCSPPFLPEPDPGMCQQPLIDYPTRMDFGVGFHARLQVSTGRDIGGGAAPDPARGGSSTYGAKRMPLPPRYAKTPRSFLKRGEAAQRGGAGHGFAASSTEGRSGEECVLRRPRPDVCAR